MSNPETVIQNQILARHGARSDLTLWRNETAGAWVGQQVARDGRRVTLANAGRIFAGLAVGSSDLIGIQHGTGRFVALEIKTATGRVTVQQSKFLAAIEAAGGLAAVVRSVDESDAVLGAPPKRAP